MFINHCLLIKTSGGTSFLFYNTIVLLRVKRSNTDPSEMFGKDGMRFMIGDLYAQILRMFLFKNMLLGGITSLFQISKYSAAGI